MADMSREMIEKVRAVLRASGDVTAVGDFEYLLTNNLSTPPESGGQGEAEIRWVIGDKVYGPPSAVDALEYANNQWWDGALGDVRIPRLANIAALYTHPPAQASGAVTEAKYHELLYAVCNKYPGESRHETALRYIRQAESQDHGPASALTQGGGMGTYRVDWGCCGSVTETEAWEPDECPFCTPPRPDWKPIKSAPKDGAVILLFRATWQTPVVIGAWNPREESFEAFGFGCSPAQPTHWAFAIRPKDAA